MSNQAVKPGCHPSLSAWGLGEVHVQNAVLLVGVASSDTMDNVVRADVVRFIAGAVVQHEGKKRVQDRGCARQVWHAWRGLLRAAGI